MAPERRGRGFTLLEVILVAGLLLLVLAALYNLLLPTLRAWVRSSQKAEAQQCAMLVVGRLRTELHRARPQPLACKSDGITFYSWADQDGLMQWNAQARVLWQRTVTLYFDADSHEVRLQERPITPTILPDPLNPDWVVGADDHVVARHIQSLDLSYPTGGPLEVQVQSVVGDQQHVLVTAMAPLEAPGLDQ